jgi:hypothetical protein
MGIQKSWLGLKVAPLRGTINQTSITGGRLAPTIIQAKI